MVQAFSKEKAAVGGLKVYETKWVPWYNDRRAKRAQQDKDDNAILLAKKKIALKEEQDADKAIAEYKKIREERRAKAAAARLQTAGKTTVVKSNTGAMKGMEDWSKRFEGISPEDEQEIKDAQLMQKALEMKMKATDLALTRMPNTQDKQRLLAKRDESRGYFAEYVTPLWNKFSNFFSKSDQGVSGLAPNEYDANFGIFPLVLWGGVVLGGVAISAAAVMAAGAYLTKARQQAALEDQILNDPSLKPYQRTELITKARDSGSILPGLPSKKVLIPLVIGVGALYVVFKVVPKFLPIPGLR